MKQSRREFVSAAAILWQAAVARAQHSHPAATTAPHHFAFFTSEERDTLRHLMARIVPADERSGGALAADVDAYIDFILQHADKDLQQIWRNGLAAYGTAIRSKSDDGIDAFLSAQSRNEFAPKTDGEKFFVVLKATVTEGFYTSEIGINQELGYQGMAFLLDFPGCTHAEHKAPSTYQPLLRQQEEL